MRNQKDSTSTVIHFTPTRVLKTDPLSAGVMTHYMHQVEMVRAIGKAFGAMVQGIRNWSRRNALSTNLNAMPDYILRDIGVRRDQIPAIVSGELKRGSLGLGLSPTGSQSAPAFYKDKKKADPKMAA
ncbi:MAG: DUF1127 domain-containing protein [Rhodospirillales bacterium]|nr:DUF1127 domain-containing protein [Rhodospirillales bacterium]